jgi:hypothetical protein
MSTIKDECPTSTVDAVVAIDADVAAIDAGIAAIDTGIAAIDTGIAAIDTAIDADVESDKPNEVEVDEATELEDINEEEIQKRMQQYQIGIVMAKPVEQALTILKTNLTLWTDIEILEKSVLQFIEMIRNKIEPPSSELIGSLKIVIGIPLVGPNGKKVNYKKAKKENGIRIIFVWNEDLKILVDPTVFNSWWLKAEKEQEKLYIDAALQEQHTDLTNRLESAKQKKNEYDALTPREKARHKLEGMKAKRVGGASRR